MLNHKPPDPTKVDPQALEAVKLDNGGLVSIRKIVCKDLASVELQGAQLPLDLNICKSNINRLRKIISQTILNE